MFYINNNLIITSDWHLNHKNIWLYEFEVRKRYINNKKYSNIQTEKDLQNFYEQNIKNNDYDKNTDFYLDAEYNMLEDIYKNLKNILKENKNITEFINLGDFIFNLSGEKFNFYSQTKNFKLLNRIFSLLKKNNINTTLFLGNHDRENQDYSLWFSNLKYVEYFNGILLSHYPYSKGKAFFIEHGIQDDLGEKIILSIHGHTHNNYYEEIKLYPNIKYLNLSFDKLIK